MKNNQDKIVIDQVLRGDVAAFSLIVEQHKKMVFTLALNILKSREDAEEAAQDTFFKAYQSLSGFKGESSVSTWLYRIVYHTAISMMRKRKESTLPLDAVDRSPSVVRHQSLNGERLEVQDRKRMLKDALMQLEDDDAFVVLLYYYKEQTVEEIAAITSLSISNVKVKLHRSRKRLQEILSVTMKTELDSLM